MNRKQFLQRTGLALGALFVAPYVAWAKHSELEDLYAFVESQHILHPVHGRIPFKLYPFQKAILKGIHEHQKVIVVQGRQIGMSHLVPAYAAWANDKKKIAPFFHSFDRGMTNDLDKRYETFGGSLKLSGTLGGAFYYDNVNFRDRPLDGFSRPLDHTLCFAKSDSKVVVYGTPDKEGVLRNFVWDRMGKRDGWTILWYPVTKCKGLWDEERIQAVSNALYPEEINRELHIVLRDTSTLYDKLA